MSVQDVTGGSHRVEASGASQAAGSQVTFDLILALK
jgi:hypothetical protein